MLPSPGLLGCVLWPMVKGGESWVGGCPRVMGLGTGPGQSERRGASDGDERKEGRFRSEDNRIWYQGNKATCNPSQVWSDELGACRLALIALSRLGPGCWNCGCHIAAPASSSPPRFGQPGVCPVFEYWEPSAPVLWDSAPVHPWKASSSVHLGARPLAIPPSPLCCALPLPETCELPKQRPWLPSSHLITTTRHSKMDRVYGSSQMLHQLS